MAFYSLGVRTPAAAAGAGYATIHTGTARARIRKISAFTSAATLSSIGIGRPANTPVATTSVLGQALDASDQASLTNIDTAWSTAPTIPAQFFERCALPATAGVGIIWTFPTDSPLCLNASSWLVLWNFGGSAGSALDVTFYFEE